MSGGGLPAQSTGAALPGLTAFGSLDGLLSREALDLARVQSSTTTSAFGRLPGAQTSLASRSGTNEWHGSLFHSFRNEKLDANDWFAIRMATGGRLWTQRFRSDDRRPVAARPDVRVPVL